MNETAQEYGSTAYEVIYNFLSCSGDFEECDTTPSDCEHNAKAILSCLDSAGYEIKKRADL
jgi:hypothetical protein